MHRYLSTIRITWHIAAVWCPYGIRHPKIPSKHCIETRTRAVRFSDGYSISYILRPCLHLPLQLLVYFASRWFPSHGEPLPFPVMWCRYWIETWDHAGSWLWGYVLPESQLVQSVLPSSLSWICVGSNSGIGIEPSWDDMRRGITHWEI